MFIIKERNKYFFTGSVTVAKGAKTPGNLLLSVTAGEVPEKLYLEGQKAEVNIEIPNN